MGLSIWHLLVVLAIVLVLFGAKRLRNLGGDLGAAIKGFKDAVTDGKKEGDTTDVTPVHTATAQQQIAPQATQSPYAAPVTPQPTVIVQQAQPTAPTAQQAGVQTPTQQTPHHHG